ncbi:hypothetical protein ACFVWG_04465 [Kribbella sp. NPDC058245]|jgi:hypothetical protein|uniref:hypothetical protein n=1 Tax=Kribbella sp. NPDC058245 TaxID=3346399 RepID=UPI0036EF3B6C
MEALSVVLNSKLVADDLRYSVRGEMAIERPKRRLWSALRRKRTTAVGRRVHSARLA